MMTKTANKPSLQVNGDLVGIREEPSTVVVGCKDKNLVSNPSSSSSTISLQDSIKKNPKRRRKSALFQKGTTTTVHSHSMIGKQYCKSLRLLDPSAPRRLEGSSVHKKNRKLVLLLVNNEPHEGHRDKRPSLLERLSTQSPSCAMMVGQDDYTRSSTPATVGKGGHWKDDARRLPSLQERNRKRLRELCDMKFRQLVAESEKSMMSTRRSSSSCSSNEDNHHHQQQQHSHHDAATTIDDDEKRSLDR